MWKTKLQEIKDKLPKDEPVKPEVTLEDVLTHELGKAEAQPVQVDSAAADLPEDDWEKAIQEPQLAKPAEPVKVKKAKKK